MSDLVVQESVALAPLTTLGIGGAARWFATAKTEADVEAAVAWAKGRGVPLFVLGGGSNLLVHDEGFAGLVLRMAIPGIEFAGKESVEVGAGEDWDRFVDFTVERGLAGVECLAGIPGSVGGTPVQNVGAYGQEVAETITQVRTYDLEQNQWVELNTLACRFRYRESLFNVDRPGRYIVTRVRFQLRQGGRASLRYRELARRFDGPAEPSLVEVARVVRSIRNSKGMLLVEGDPDCRSAGSFFKNPIVAAKDFSDVAAKAGVGPNDVPHWPAADGRIKLPAAWLMERAGFHKGWGEGAAGLSSKHTLAVVNRGGATFADVARLQEVVVAGVEEKFGVRLEREPVVLGEARSKE
jgi:UDP-N-acetylmuramate dehydrogenase